MKATGMVICIVVALALIASTTFLTGANPLWYVDGASVAVTLGLTLLLLRASWSFRDMGAAFRNALSDTADKKELTDAALFFRAMAAYAPLAGLVGLFIGGIALLGNLGRQEVHGFYLAIALLTSFYGIIVTLVIAFPFGNAAKRRLARLGNGETRPGA